MSTFRPLAALTLSCALLAAAPAFARPAGESGVVRIADLDLATPAGEQALRARVARAARLVCGDADVRDLAAMRDASTCRADAMAKAAPQIALALDQARNGAAYAANHANRSHDAGR